jgi:glycosyltransferase involved in cell wall biosynthesis
MRPPHILFLSTLNFTSNPRLYKEVLLALQQGFNVSVLLFKLGNWSDEQEAEKLKQLQGAQIHYLSAKRLPLLPWIFSTALERLMQLTPHLSSLKGAAFAHSKRTILIMHFLKKLSPTTINMVVAHNLGTLYPAYYLNKQYKIPFGFDVEDYHPGEWIKGENTEKEQVRRKYLMQKVLPKTSYISYASPLISRATEALLQGGNLPASRQTILNSFPTSEFPRPETPRKGPLRIVWFSQNITTGRGLELLLPALEKFQDYLQVTLIGKLSPKYAPFIKNYFFVQIQDALPQPALHEVLRSYDIGVACEISAHDENKQMALSNKILAYKQAGLFILATNTPGQQDFLSNFPEESLVVSQEVEAFTQAIAKLVENKDTIRATRTQRYASGKIISWEKEAAKLMSCWKTILYR